MHPLMKIEFDHRCFCKIHGLVVFSVWTCALETSLLLCVPILRSRLTFECINYYTGCILIRETADGDTKTMKKYKLYIVVFL